MQPINSKYIYFVHSQLTLITIPWYKIIDRQETDGVKWQEATLVTGCYLKELGAKIQDSDICKFFDITTDPVLLNSINRWCPLYALQACICL